MPAQEPWTAHTRRATLAAVTRFEKAVEDLTLKGSMHPDDHLAIERRYTLAKANSGSRWCDDSPRLDHHAHVCYIVTL